MTIERRLWRIIAVLTGLLGALAFAVSFHSISGFAVQVGAMPSSWSWSAPLLVDVFTFIGTLEVLRSGQIGKRAAARNTGLGMVCGNAARPHTSRTPPLAETKEGRVSPCRWAFIIQDTVTIWTG
jgi:hypothetical protein